MPFLPILKLLALGSVITFIGKYFKTMIAVVLFGAIGFIAILYYAHDLSFTAAMEYVIGILNTSFEWVASKTGPMIESFKPE